MSATGSISSAIDAKGWHRLARYARSPNCDARPPAVEPELIVIHSISLPRGCYGNGLVEHFFTNRLDCSLDPALNELRSVRVSAHFLISRPGRLTQFVSCVDRAWHAGRSRYRNRSDCNSYSIGIELEGRCDQAYTAAQYLALSQLCADLIERFPALDAQRIAGHQHIAPERKTDPGSGFDWSELFAGLSRIHHRDGHEEP